MSPGEHAIKRPHGDNRARAAGILALAAASAALYGWAAWRGDLRDDVVALLAVHALLVAGMLAAWRIVARGGPGVGRIALGAALAFRILLAAGPEPALSDDLYRYVWDGRVQAYGIHPYRFAPDAPALENLRDASWGRINHPELRTIYPPAAQIVFAALARAGLGVRGFKLAAAAADFAVVLALGALLARLGLPGDRRVLYAWNPLAVIETAGSGHYEPIGVVLILLAALWTLRDRPGRAAAALAVAIQAKLLPAVLVPGYVRRWRWTSIAVLATVLVAVWLPYAWTGPAIGPGSYDYAERWQRNAFVFAGVLGAIERLDPTPWIKRGIAAAQTRLGEDALPWDWLYRHVWPPHLARAVVAALALAWVGVLAFGGPRGPARESFLALAGVLLLAPTLHPWYVLWVLPLAAAWLSRGWLLLAALVPLAYLGGEGDVPPWARAIEFVPSLGLMAFDALRARQRGTRRRLLA